jgi:ABC-type sugar transport system ATPase subunit
MANVRLETITRKLEDVTAIEGITFEVPDGQFWVLVGPSGCGKSTILRASAGLESATDGNLLGRETLIRGSLPTSDVTLNVQAPSNWRGRPGDRISVQLDLNQLFVFDPTTGDARYP